MRKVNKGWMMAVALGLAIPSFSSAYGASKASASGDQPAPTSMSKDDQAKLAEHVKLRNEIKKVKYPAPKSSIVSHVKGIKPDDKKWFTETLPDKTYESADDVFSALGWETTAAAPSK